MRNIPPPTQDAMDLYDTISARRQEIEVRDRLSTARPLIEDAYREYSVKVPEVAGLDPADTTPATTRDLNRNYDLIVEVEGKTGDQLLIRSKRGKCALCAFGIATTLDHYLPKKKYPEFSILPINLIPACKDCNHEKGSKYERDGEAMFIHAYHDAIPNEQFLFAEIMVENGDIVPSFRVETSELIAASLGRKLESHFIELKLDSVYRIVGTEEIADRLEMFRGYVAADDLEVDLEREADSVREKWGVNHWKFALLSALSANAARVLSAARS